jgi:amidase
MPIFQQEIMEMAQAKGPLTETEYLEALATSKRVSQQAINSLMVAHNLDALIVPTEGPAWFTDHINGDLFPGISSSSYAAISGYASITVPAGYVSGLPIGLSFIGDAFSDARLIRYAYAFEQATAVRRPPPLD